MTNDNYYDLNLLSHMPKFHSQLFYLDMRGQSKNYLLNIISISIKHLAKCKELVLNNRSAITLNNGTLILHKKINILVQKYYCSYYSVKRPNICPTISGTPTPNDDVECDVNINTSWLVTFFKWFSTACRPVWIPMPNSLSQTQCSKD